MPARAHVTTPDSGSRAVDRAALLGAALAAVVALTFGGQGEWDWLAACAGVALLAVLAAFFRLPAAEHRSRRTDRAELAALAAVAALASALVIAAPLQALIENTTQAGRTCKASAAVAAALVVLDEDHQQAASAAVPRLAAEGAATTQADALVQAAEDVHRNVRDVCLGASTSRWLWLPAACVAILIFLVGDLRMRRRDRSAGPPAADDPA